MQKNNKNGKGLIITGILIAAIIYFFGGEKNDIDQMIKDKFPMIILIIYVLLIYIVNFFKSERVDRFVEVMQDKEKINSLITTIVLVFLATTFINVQSNGIAERQVEIEDRETAPSLSVESYQNGYKIENEKGMASYVTFNGREKYNFMYQGEAYEVSLTTFYREQDDRYNLGGEYSQLIFKPETAVIDQDKAYDILKKYIYEKTGEEINISDSKELELDFYDYKNESHSFQYSEYEGKIRLINTADNYVPTHNISVPIMDTDQMEDQIKYAIEYLL